MNTQETIALFDKYVIGNYSRIPNVIVKGEGSKIWDADGREYLDMFPGWATSAIGHCPPRVVAAVKQQVEKLIHMDNTFYTEPQGLLASMLSERAAFGGKCFFCNSGAESVEAALKLARRHTAKGKYKIISTEGSFHGRTMGAMTATAQPKKHQGFLPLVPGFIYVPFNDIDALKQSFDDEVAGVIVEPVQGEGGIRIADQKYLEAIRELCDQHGAVAIWDEVQSGMGRTGKWFAFQHSDVVPDIMTLAKALGGGVAIGAIMAREEVAASLVPGTHASTFGGNPLACAASIATIESIEAENMLENARTMGRYAQEKLNQLKEKYNTCIDHVRGLGLMIGIQLNEPGDEIVKKCWDKGLRINCTQGSVLRFMPTLNVTSELIDQAIAIMDDAFNEIYSQERTNG
ncbi:MAG: aspartate aminotransferase family protein [Sedimentisphaerales bacterium]|nr:aspartate aminotransferase family protein [Sedimentisphaerales bacterium]